MQLAIGQYNDVDFKAHRASPDFCWETTSCEGLLCF